MLIRDPDERERRQRFWSCWCKGFACGLGAAAILAQVLWTSWRLGWL